MSLRIEHIWVRGMGDEEALSWTAENVQRVTALNSWPEDNNSDSFIRAAKAGTDVVIEEFKWSGAGSRDIESLRYIVSLSNEADNLEVWVRWDDGSPMHCVWPIDNQPD